MYLAIYIECVCFELIDRCNNVFYVEVLKERAKMYLSCTIHNIFSNDLRKKHWTEKNNIMHRCLNVNIEYIQQKRMKLRELKQTTKNWQTNKKNYKNDKEYIFEKKSYLCFSVIFVIYFCFFLFTYKYNFFVLQLFLL